MPRLWIAVGCLSCLAVAVAAEPVKVSVAPTTFKMWTAPLQPDRMYPVEPDKALAEPLQAKIKARRQAVKTEFEAGDPGPAQEAAAAAEKLKALPKDQRDTPEAKALAALVEAQRVKLEERYQKDAELAKLNAELLALRNSTRKLEDVTVPVVTLNNGLIEVKIVPALGMRVLNAVDLKTGQSFAGTAEPRAIETQPLSDLIGWDAGYIEASFPYFEHGMGGRQPGGWRTIQGPDGSATVAMNMRFTGHQNPRDVARYGRYAQAELSVWITLRPGESRFDATWRLDNPLPLRRSDRLWINHIFQTDGYAEKFLLYPSGYVIPHGGQSVAAFYAPGGTPQFLNRSDFALYTDYGFCGVYSPTRDTNCLVLSDPKIAPGFKMYTPNKPASESGKMEFWIGSGPVFEDPGRLIPAFQPVEFTTSYYNVTGLGRVSYANRDVAIVVQDKAFSLVTPFSAQAEVSDASGKVVASGPVGPGTPLKGTFDKKLVVKLDGKVAADVAFPLTYTDTRARLDEVKPLGGKFRLELEENVNHIGAPTGRDAMPAAEKLVAAGKVEDPAGAVSLAYTCYRYGHFDLALKVLALVGPTPEGDLLKGLIAWERGEKVDFGQAGVDANYLRALQAIQAGETAKAISLLDEQIKARPTTYRPRLLRAYLAKDVPAAKALAAENPASPEAQLVLELLGVDGAAKAKADLLRDNPEAPEQVAAFEKELTKGQWVFVRRYGPSLPKTK